MKMRDNKQLTSLTLAIFNKMCVVYIILSFTVVAMCQGTPTIQWPAKDKTATVGQGPSVQFECTVKDLENHNVTWTFLTHHVQISHNLELLTTEYEHYSIVRPEGVGGPNYPQFNLQIKRVRLEDSGLYRCQIQGTNVNQTVRLTVTGPSASPSPPLPPANFTDCCVQEQVSSTCIPACVPSTLNLNTFNPAVQCQRDFIKVLKCGTDHRNHYPCCEREGVPEACRHLCIVDSIQDIKNLTVDEQCMNVSKQILSCYEEGAGLLPGPPTLVHAVGVTNNTVSVSWEKPTSLASVTGYRVFYRKAGTTGPYKSTGLVEAESKLLYVGIVGNTVYDIYVIAVNHHGSSLPSYHVEATSLESMPARSGNSTNVLDCCSASGMPSNCKKYLCDTNGHLSTYTIIPNCVSHISTAYQCLSDGRNHTSCCQRRNVSSSCLQYCSGQPQQTGWTQLHCTLELPRIEACIEEGGKLIPSMPENVRLGSITDKTAELLWDPPQYNSDKVIHYVVEYRKRSSPQLTMKVEVSGIAMSAQLSGLDSDTLYEVTMRAHADHGDSLTASQLLFLTQPPPDDTPVIPSVTPNEPIQQNFTACCMQHNVSNECLDICSYEFNNNLDADNSQIQKYMNCRNHLNNIFACGADERNHEPCCEEVALSSECRPLCSISYRDEFQFDFNTHFSCITESSKILQCMRTGTEVLPGSPGNFVVKNVTEHAAVLTWTPPTNTADKVEQYIVMYAQGRENQIWKESDAGNFTTYVIQHLVPDTVYKVKVIAANKNGSSQPTPVEIFRTLAIETVPVVNTSEPIVNHTDCCQKLNISSACLPYCVYNDEDVPLTCVNEVMKMFSCRAKHTNNEACCRRQNVPPMCLGLCRGEEIKDPVANVVCLVFFSSMMTCVNTGIVNHPSQPENLKTMTVGLDQIELQWSEPRRNSEGVWYDLYYRHYDQTNAKTLVLRNVTSPYRIQNLQNDTKYEIYVMALNRLGASPPSTSIVVDTERPAAAHVFEVKMVPASNIREGSRVILDCQAMGIPKPTVYWTRSGTVVYNGTTYTISLVSRSDVGRYICHAQNIAGPPSAKSIDLQVIYQPTVYIAVPVIKVIPNEGRSSTLHCEFRGGLSLEDVYWMRNNQELTNNIKYHMIVNQRPELGVTELYMMIRYTSDLDLGNYTCVGKNALGNITGAIQIIDPRTLTTTTLPTTQRTTTVIAPTKPANVTECCIKEGVSPVCVQACQFDIDVGSFLQSSTGAFQCIFEAPKLLRCGADGKDHSKCCYRKGVPQVCHDACRGSLPDNVLSQPSLAPCVLFLQDIVDCMEAGNKTIPSAPRNPVLIVSSRNIELYWEKPIQNPDKVQNYMIMYGYQGAKQKNITTHSSARKGLLPINYLEKNKNYTVSVIAANHHGQSHPSRNLTLSTKAPDIPKNVHLVNHTDDKYHITWDGGVQHSETSTLYYIVYNVAGDHILYTNTSSSPAIVLDNLRPGMLYELEVVASNVFGKSERSNTLVFQTEGGKVGNSSPTTGDANTVGIAVGITVTLLIIVIAVLAAMFYYYRIHKKPRFKESVQFENPGYATTENADSIQISGLPGENIYTEINNVNHHPNNNLNHKKEIPVQVDSEFTEVGSPEVRTLSHVNGSIPNHHQNEVEDGNSEPPEQTEHIDHHKTNGRATLDITEMQRVESKNHIKLHLTDPIEHTTDTVT